MFGDKNRTICCKGKLLSLESPLVMGIVNFTNNSFYAGSRNSTMDAVLANVEQMLEEGAAIIDVGALSTRPFAEEIPEKEELDKIVAVVKSIVQKFPDVVLSVDTYRSAVAKAAVEEGATIINDISAGIFDNNMLSMISELNVPYIAMHTKGKPSEMQNAPVYDDVFDEVFKFLSARALEANKLGINDVIIDPGFGFGKTLEHNYELLSRLEGFSILDKPVLVGLSRKSMIQKVLSVEAQDALNGTSVLNTVALLKKVSILRVHDVKEAVQCVKLIEKLEKK